MADLRSFQISASVTVPYKLRTESGLSAMATTGSIASGSNQLLLSSRLEFGVGDWVIVEVGGEAGGGAMGTRGVGGTHPSLSYANLSAMNADSTQNNGKLCWVEESGEIYEWSSSLGNWSRPSSSQKYIQKAIPKALWAQITAVSGNIVTLSKAAAVTATDANVYFDNWGVLQGLIAANTSVNIPVGTFYCSDFLYLYGLDGRTIRGGGKTQTFIRTPKGASLGGIIVHTSTGVTVEALTIDLGFKNTSFSLRWADGRAGSLGWGYATPNDALPSGWNFGQGVFFYLSDDGTARNVLVKNPAQQAVCAQYSTNVWAYNCDAVIEDPILQYTQWMFQWADISSENNGGGCVDCTVDSNWYVAGFESFRSHDVSFIRCSTRNAVFANNTSDGTILDSMVFVLEDQKQYDSTSFSIANPVLSYNTNIGSGYNAKASTITNVTVICDAADASGNRLRGLIVGADTCHVNVTGTYDSDYSSPKGLFHMRTNGNPSGNGSEGLCAIVTGEATFTGIRFRGNAPGSPQKRMAYMENGTFDLVNCILDAGYQGSGGTVTESGTLTNAEFDALHPGLP